MGLNRNHMYVQCVFVVESTKDLISSEACANGDEKEELTREKEGGRGGGVVKGVKWSERGDNVCSFSQFYDSLPLNNRRKKRRFFFQMCFKVLGQV